MPQTAIVLVHLGDSLPAYLNDCIAQLALHTSMPVHVVVPEMLAQGVPPPALVLPVETLVCGPKRLAFEQGTTLDRGYRGGFWKFASERFFVLEQAMETLALDELIHLENDVLLYTDPARLLPTLRAHYSIASTFDNDSRCIPGFVYVGSRAAMAELTTLLLLCKGANDMMALAAIRNARPALIDNLPILPDFWRPTLRSTNGQTTREPARYSRHFADFGGVFDAAALGQYIGGVDPHNRDGDTRGFVNEACLFQPNELQISWRKNERGLLCPWLSHEGREFPAFTLHIHCKDLARYRSDSSTR